MSLWGLVRWPAEAFGELVVRFLDVWQPGARGLESRLRELYPGMDDLNEREAEVDHLDPRPLVKWPKQVLRLGVDERDRLWQNGNARQYQWNHRVGIWQWRPADVDGNRNWRDCTTGPEDIVAVDGVPFADITPRQCIRCGAGYVGTHLCLRSETQSSPVPPAGANPAGVEAEAPDSPLPPAGASAPDTVTRVVLVHAGGFTEKWAESWDVHVQDDGRTLKLFPRNPTGPRYQHTPGFFSGVLDDQVGEGPW